MRPFWFQRFRATSKRSARRKRVTFALLLCFLGLASWNLGRLPDLTFNVETQLSSLSLVKHNKQPAFTFWSSDAHIGPIEDVKYLLAEWYDDDYRIIDKSLSSSCHLKGTCAQDLKVLNRTNAIHLSPCPNELKREFWRAYRNDDQMSTVDAFFCHHATGLCEVFMAFGRPMIIVVSTRYEIGRRTRQAWQRLNENLKAIASNPRNTIAANNRYDAEYIKHFTGLSQVRVLPNYCGYTNALYKPTRPEILIAPGRFAFGVEAMLLSGPKGIVKAAQNHANLKYKEFRTIRQLYKHYTYEELASHPAIVLIPYQVSTMSFFEYYRMGIPLFVPSPDLLTVWQQKLKVVSEISWNCVYGRCQDTSQVEGHPNSTHGNKDPNNVNNNFRYWIQFADFYQFPHITLFDDWKDLLEKLNVADLNGIRYNMMEYNNQQKKVLKREWNEILDKAFRGLYPRSSWSKQSIAFTNQSWEDAVLQHYPTVSKHDLVAKC